MFEDRPFWCPNVVLLEQNQDAMFSSSQIEFLISRFRNLETLMFVQIGSRKQLPVNSKIIIDTGDYAIYRVAELNQYFSESFKPGIKQFYAYYIASESEMQKMAFIHFVDILGFDYPIICQSDNLMQYLSPAIVILPEGITPEHDLNLKVDRWAKTEIINLSTMKIHFIQSEQNKLHLQKE